MSFSVQQIIEWTGGRLVNVVTAKELRVVRPAELGRSKADELAYFFSREYQAELMTAKAGVLITGESFVKPLEQSGLPLWKTAAIIACKDPYYAMAILSEKFAAKLSTVAHLESSTRIDQLSSIDPSAKIGSGTVIYSGCFIGPRVQVGKNCVIFPNVTIYEDTVIGDGVRLHAGVVIGADGFGYAPLIENGVIAKQQKIYHLGRVVIGDDVEIGANACVDRSTMGETLISKGAKLDNHVHIGHNAVVGEYAIICGGTCLAGQARVGRYAYIGGMAGIANQVHVGDGAKVGAMTLVTKDVPPGSVVVGNPQREHREHFKVHALLNKMASDRQTSRARKIRDAKND